MTQMGDAVDRARGVRVVRSGERDSRFTNKMFQKGNKLGGRPKGFKALVKEIRKRADAKTLVDFAMKVFEDKDDEYWMGQRWEAFMWLTRYGYGLPMQTVQIDAMLEAKVDRPPGIDLKAMTSDQRAAFRKALLIATGDE